MMQIHRMKHQGTMSKVEKAMNKGELRGFKQHQPDMRSMLPGLASDSPFKPEHASLTQHVRFPKCHALAPPKIVDNSLTFHNSDNNDHLNV